jgi:hypothetical protein
MEFTKHALLKLNEREIKEIEITHVLQNPKEIFLDTETSNIVVVGDRMSKFGHKLIVVLSENMTKVITLIDTSKTDIIDKRKEKGRWIKIK